MVLPSQVFDVVVAVEPDCLRMSLQTPSGEVIVEMAYNELPPKLVEAIINKMDGELNKQEQLLCMVRKLSREPKEASRKEST